MINPREQAWLLKEKYKGQQTEEFQKDLKRLEKGEPLAYVIGYIPFLNTTIHLDSYPLIPRPETEFWTEEVIAELSTHQVRLRILDMCAGSGCIGVAVLKAHQHAQVDFVEIDVRHHPTIKKNLMENGIRMDRAHVIDSDLFANVRGTYDYILANPPYIDITKIDRVEQSVKDFEPQEALYGGNDGLTIIARLIAKAPTCLSSGGVMYLEHEPVQTDAIHELGTRAGFRNIATHNDQFKQERFTRMAV